VREKKDSAIVDIVSQARISLHLKDICFILGFRVKKQGDDTKLGENTDGRKRTNQKAIY
jgi:hypothetical protein